MSRDELFEEAVGLGDRLVEEAYWNEGRCNWVAARRKPGPHGGALAEALDPTVHAGTAGIALFLARLSRYTGDFAHKETAEGAIRHSLKFARYCEPHPPYPNANVLRTGEEWRFGFYLGSLGIAWTAHETGRLLGEPTLQTAARRLHGELTKKPGRIHELDLMKGAASAIPTFLSLASEGFPDAQRHAEGMANALIRRGYVRGDAWSWGAEASQPHAKDLTGLSHGASGMAYGLASMYEATGEDAFRAGALGACAYERLVFDDDLKNWPDFTGKPTEGRYPARSSWCHGSPGIGLARARLCGVLKEKPLLDDLETARDTTRRALERSLDEQVEGVTLCCGTLGRAACLLAMENVLRPDASLRQARDVASLLVRRYGAQARRDNEGWVDWPTAPKGSHPGLFQGYAGVGHFLLQLHDPSRVPSVLLPALSMG